MTVFYSVGIVGIGWRLEPDLLSLTPLNLLLSLSVMLWNHENWDRSFFLFLIGSFLIGFGVEVLGVNTGFPFGEYSYGSVLGFKLWETPLMIGINWVMLSYCGGVIANYLISHQNIYIKSGFGALLLLLLDFIMEPVAIHYGFWTWEKPHVPIENYLSWFVIAFLIQILFFSFVNKVNNKAAIFLFILQIAFFGLLSVKL